MLQQQLSQKMNKDAEAADRFEGCGCDGRISEMCSIYKLAVHMITSADGGNIWTQML